MATILMPLPDADFDVTEVAVPWKLLTEAGHRVVFATENGAHTPHCDPLLLSGVLFGQLGAAPEAKAFYAQMEGSQEFSAPVSWKNLEVSRFDGLILAGGHAPGMRQYLGSGELQEQVRAFVALDRPWGAICHGPLVAARAGVLKGKKTTCLPKYMERNAYFLTAWKLGTYYRTYPAYVEDEVKASLAQSADFVRGPKTLLARGTRDQHAPAFVLEDGQYVSARWPGDAYLFAQTLLKKLTREPKGR
jgi:putative intracellular protease/amidase